MRIPPLVATVLLLTGCGEETNDAGSQSGPDLDGRTFIATSIEDRGATRLLVGGTELRLSFENGGLGINAGCNHMHGDYQLAGTELTVHGVSTTDMGCEPNLMAQDAWVSALFTEPLTVDLAGDDLRLTSEGVEVLLTDRKVASPDVSLEGTTWVLDALISDDAVSSVPGGIVATFFVDGDQVRIDTGCNALRGTVSVADGTLTLADLAATEIKCTGDQAEVEDAVTAVIADSATWSITERSLTIMRGTEGLGFRVA